jgi:CubicO group peptidase (beta-lactamase class C family)
VKWFLPVLFLSMLAPRSFADNKNEPPKPAQSIPELRQQIEKILKDARTPGTSIAIVNRDGMEWVDGVGKADVANHRAVTAQTLFSNWFDIKGIHCTSDLAARRSG